MIGSSPTTSSYLIINICMPIAGTATMLLHSNGKFTMGKLKSSKSDSYKDKYVLCFISKDLVGV
jgi:hypothetical protein